MLSERTIEILGNNEMKAYDRDKNSNGEYTREIEFFSPEGEDVIECIWYDGTDEGFIKAFRENAEHFDPDEHAEMWVESRGTRGVPESIKDLIADAEWIKNTLLAVADELEAEETTENLSCMNRRQFYNYILENFDISGEAGRLINNILCYVESQGMEENEQYRTLCSLLDGTIGLTDNELKRVYL